jgi:hypothetical protein
VAFGLTGLHASGLANGAAVEQQFLGQRRFAGVGVADDGKRASFIDLIPVRTR